MQYASALAQYKTDEFGGFDIGEVEKEINRGNKLRCSICRSSKPKRCKGASCGCAVKWCRKTFHYPCAFRDPDTITKRLVVTTNKHSNSKEKFVYYRVFCSKDHEVAFRDMLRDELRDGKTKRKKRDRTSDEGEEASQEEEEEEGGDRAVATPSRAKVLAEGASFLSPGGDQAATSFLSVSPFVPPQDSEALSPGQRLLLSFANNVSRDEAVETRRASRSQSQVPDLADATSSWAFVAMPESRSGAVDAAVVVHNHTTQDSWHGEAGREPSLVQSEGDRLPNFLDLAATDNTVDLAATDSTEQSSFTPPLRPTRSCRLAASHGPSDSAPVVSPDSVSDKHVRRSPRKNADLNSGTKPSEVTSQASPQTPSVNSVSWGQQRVAKEVLHMPQNGHAEGDMMSDSTSGVDAAPTSTRSMRSRRTDLRNDSSVSAVPAHTSPLLNVSENSVADSSELSDRPADGARGNRKRKMDKVESSRNGPSCNGKSGRTENSLPTNLASVLLIPSNMGEFKRLERQVIEMATEAVKVKADNVCVWQAIVRRSLPSELLVFFLLELVKELKNDDSETLLNLLFDEEHLAAKENSYVVQAKILQNLKDEQSQKDVQLAIWGGVERNVKDLPMVHVLRVPGHHLLTLAIDVRHCVHSRKVQAYLQAHKGLSWWDADTEVAAFQLSPSDRCLAEEAEVWTWKVWLTQVCPVSEVVVLPTDTYMQDRHTAMQSPELEALVTYLQDRMGAEGAPRRGRGLLLLFMPVDLDVVDFRRYFSKVCVDVLQTRTSGSVLALLPLHNLRDQSYLSLCSLLGPGQPRYSVSVRSAFLPRVHLTTLVLLEITTTAVGSGSSGPAVTEGSGVTSPTKVKEKRRPGRPKKHPETQ
ncbi:uncharacterized protein LOC143289875 isoform X2 [Babylonia areolata]